MAKGEAEVLTGYLGVGISTDGRLTATGVLRIDGSHRGTLVAGGGTVSLGPQAYLGLDSGEVGSLIVQGRMDGTVTIRDGLEVDASGQVRGSIRAGWLVVEEGGVVDGNLDVGIAGDGEDE